LVVFGNPTEISFRATEKFTTKSSKASTKRADFQVQEFHILLERKSMYAGTDLRTQKKYIKKDIVANSSLNLKV